MEYQVMPGTTISAEELLSRYAAGERDFSGTGIKGELSDANLSGADFRDASLSECYMPRVNMSRANLCNALLIETCLNVANLAGADLRRCRLSRTQLVQANLTDTNMRGVQCSNTDFNGANLTRADLREANLKASFRGANLTDADLEDANISGADFENTIMPDGSSLTRPPLEVYRMGIIIAEADGGGYYAQCPDIDCGVVTADSLAGARERIIEVVEQYLLYVLPESQGKIFVDRHFFTEIIEIPSDM